MRVFMYLVILASTLAAYLSSPDVGLAPKFVKFLPDVLSGIIVIYVALAGVRQNFRYVSAKYWLVFAALAFDIACGVLINQEPVGPVLNGMRYYLRAIPLFFLPAVVNFSDADLRRYLQLLLGLSVLQMPVSVWQRLHYLALGHSSGDYIIGTLMVSGIESLFIIAVLCVMGALMLRGQLSKVWFAILFVILVIPISINETKVTIFLLPAGLLATFMIASPPKRRLRVMFQALAFLVIAAAIFVPLYDRLNKGIPGQFSVEAFLSNPQEMGTYMDRQAKVGTDEEAGRWDSLKAPFAALGHDPIKMTFGLGLGNASKSSLGSQYSGQYRKVYWNFVLELSVTAFLFEIGLLGTALVLLLHGMVLRDALYVARHRRDLLGTLALGYVGAWLTVTIGLFYLSIHTFESLAFMFWFFSGLFAAQRQRILVSRSAQRSIAPMHLPAQAAGLR